MVLKHGSSYITYYDFRKHCERYGKYDYHDVLQKLFTATVGLGYDRRIIYFSLLAHFCAQKETSRALDLWRMQRAQNEEPSSDFLLALVSYLNEIGIKVPFAMPEPEQPLLRPSVSPEGLAETEKPIKEGNVDAALNIGTKSIRKVRDTLLCHLSWYNCSQKADWIVKRKP